jgi:phage protein U
MMLVLGGYYFSIDTAAYQKLEHLRTWNWVESEVIDQAPDLQFTGPAAETIMLEGTIFTAWKGGTLQMEALSLLAGRGVPYLMVAGTGMIFGFWVILSIEQKKCDFIDNGQPKKIEFYIHLKRFGNMTKALAMLATNPLSAVGL